MLIAVSVLFSPLDEKQRQDNRVGVPMVEVASSELTWKSCRSSYGLERAACAGWTGDGWRKVVSTIDSSQRAHSRSMAVAP